MGHSFNETANAAFRYAFTMAEILLSLTIIGVVAAITLPSLTGNINERTWNTQRKALYSRLSQAIALMPALNGYGSFIEGTDSVSAVDTATETFITDGLAKVLKINNVCDSEHLADCGIPTKVLNFAGEQVSSIPKKLSDLNPNISGSYNPIFDTKAAAFETANGESILLYYSPDCRGNKQDFDPNRFISNDSQTRTHQKVCANFIYDLNGSKGPNTIGKDMGIITAFDPTDPILAAPIPANLTIDGTYKTRQNAIEYCKKFDGRLTNIYESISIVYNYKFISVNNNFLHYSNVCASVPSSGNIIRISNSSGALHTVPVNGGSCVVSICNKK